jgi:hypothetical protein
MFDCTVVEGPVGRVPKHSSPYNFTLTNSTESYVLTTKTEPELKEWVKLLNLAIQRGKKQIDVRKATMIQQVSVRISLTSN